MGLYFAHFCSQSTHQMPFFTNNMHSLDSYLEFSNRCPQFITPKKINIEPRKVMECLLEPRPKDVLLGRTSEVFKHPGNCRYRHLITAHLRSYIECNDRLDKMNLIKSVAQKVLDNGSVRVLRRDKNNKWKECSFRAVYDKVSHALRDGIERTSFPWTRQTSIDSAEASTTTKMRPSPSQSIRPYATFRSSAKNTKSTSQSTSRVPVRAQTLNPYDGMNKYQVSLVLVAAFKNQLELNRQQQEITDSIHLQQQKINRLFRERSFETSRLDIGSSLLSQLTN